MTYILWFSAMGEYATNSAEGFPPDCATEAQERHAKSFVVQQLQQ